jgi:hypothetical protein
VSERRQGVNGTRGRRQFDRAAGGTGGHVEAEEHRAARERLLREHVRTARGVEVAGTGEGVGREERGVEVGRGRGADTGGADGVDLDVERDDRVGLVARGDDVDREGRAFDDLARGEEREPAHIGGRCGGNTGQRSNSNNSLHLEIPLSVPTHVVRVSLPASTDKRRIVQRNQKSMVKKSLCCFITI